MTAIRVLLVWTSVLGFAIPAAAQIAMPDPRQMSGIPRPVTDLPDRTISVRLIRGDLSNNIANHPVELYVDGLPQTVTTGEDGRAQFGPLDAGRTVRAVTVVDGERLESQEFPSPQQGGIRLMLVATDKEKEAQTARERAAPATTGEVAIGGETRIVIEGGDAVVRVFYLLDIVNTARTGVNPLTPFMFDLPTGAVGAVVMEGSSPQASVIGTRVRVQGPFASGTTPVRIGFVLPVPRGAIDIEQRFPASVQRLGVLVEKQGEARLSSRQIERQQDMPLGDRTYVAAAVGAVASGAPLMLSLSGFPHHSLTPRFVALTLVGVIVLAGIWAARRPVPQTGDSDRKRLLARREKLMNDLVRLETEHRRARLDPGRYASRREAIIAALVQVYGALHTDDTSPGPASRSGLAA